MAKRTISLLENDRILMRLLERADLPLTLSWRNQDHIRKWFLNTAVIPEDAHYTWFERYQVLDNDFIFLILAKELSNTPVGQISIYGIDWGIGTAEFGRLMIGEPRARGLGLAKEATFLLLDYCLGVLKLNEILLEVKEDNAAAVSIYRAVGFVETRRNNGLLTMSFRVKS